MQADVVVLGAGMVGVSIAAHLQKRGKQVVLVDRRPPGEETSYGNAGMVQREAVFPHPFPRSVAELRRIARNRSVDAYYHLSALPGFARPLFDYWRNSGPERYAVVARQYSTLIATCTAEHKKLADEAGSTELLRPVGYIRTYENPALFDADRTKAEIAKREFDVNSVILDPAGLVISAPSTGPTLIRSPIRMP
jgi:D-amino-acid dehydrogenase